MLETSQAKRRPSSNFPETRLIVVASAREGDLAATPQFCGTTSTLQIRKKKL
jgi:hypothetical protein